MCLVTSTREGSKTLALSLEREARVRELLRRVERARLLSLLSRVRNSYSLYS
jgi:hypothetical protein